MPALYVVQLAYTPAELMAKQPVCGAPDCAPLTEHRMDSVVFEEFRVPYRVPLKTLVVVLMLTPAWLTAPAYAIPAMLSPAAPAIKMAFPIFRIVRLLCVPRRTAATAAANTRFATQLATGAGPYAALPHPLSILMLSSLT